MFISTKDWKNYIDKMSKLNKGAADAIIAYVQKNGFRNTDELIGYAYNVVQTYGNGSAALAAAMYDATAEAAGQFYDPAEPGPLPEYGDVAKTVYGTLKKSQNVNEIAGAVSRLVKKTGADTTLINAYRDRPKKRYGKKRHTGAQVAWVPMGDTCPFCLMLASNGWQNQTEGGADKLSGHIHANCDCNYAVRFDDYSGVDGYDPDQYKEMFSDMEGDTWNEKVNAMRRKQYEQDKDRINAQKRAAYAEKKIQEEIKSIEETPFVTRVAVGAMARRFYVESETQLKYFDDLYIKPGTYVNGVKVIAAGKKIHDVKRLINEYKLPNGDLTKAEDWFKVRGKAMITDGTKDLGIREVHWYQAKNIGKVEFKFPSNPRQI